LPIDKLDGVYFSNDLGVRTYSCLKGKCPGDLPRLLSRKELLQQTSVEECLVRDGCPLFEYS
jgi:hypothetical protein